MNEVEWIIDNTEWFNVMHPYIAKFVNVDALDGDEAYELIMHAFAEYNDCVYKSNADSFVCSEETFLIIKLKYPNLINNYTYSVL
jgi:hypothetical protein